MMTLEEAINHAKEKAKCGGRCGEEHEQLAGWLKELQTYRADAYGQKTCEYCHKNFDGFVRPIEKNSHAYVWFSGFEGWHISLQAKGWDGSAPINYCPMCGRRLTHGSD